MTWLSLNTKTFFGLQQYIIMLACSIVLTLSLVSSTFFEFVSLNKDSKARLASVSDIIAAETAAAVLFNDTKAINNTLQSLSADATITQMFVLDSQGVAVGRYGRSDQPHTTRDIEQSLKRIRQLAASQSFFELRSCAIRPIIQDGEQLGSILVELDSRISIRKMLLTGGIDSLILLVSMFGSYLLARRLGRIVTDPIKSLVATMEIVATTRNYNTRANVDGVIELTQISDGLNTMLGEIARRDTALYESEEMFRHLFENSRDAIMTLKPSPWKYASGNPATVSMFLATDEEDFASHSPWDLSPERQPDGSTSIEKAKEMLETALRDGYHFFEWTHRRIGGEEFFADVLLTRIDLKGEELLQATVRDITERKQAELSLQNSQKRLSDIIDFLPDATLAIDMEKRIIIWNRVIEEMTGVLASEMIGKGDYAYTIPFYGDARPQLMDLVFEDREELAARYLNITREGDTLSAEVFCPAVYNNKGAWLFVKASPLYDQSRNIVGAIESIRDITELKQAEVELQESGVRYRALFAGASDGIIILSTEGKLIDVNDAIAKMHGYSISEMLQMGLKDLDTPETASLIPERMQRILAGEYLTFEVEHYHRDGHTFPLEVSSSLISFGGESYVQCFHRDISERKRAEEERRQFEQQLLHTQRLESLGVLAGGIAHDFNNILTVIMGHCYLADEGLDSEQEYKAAFRKVEAAGNRATDLCRQMLTYAGKSESEQSRLSLWLLVDEVVKMLRSAIKKNVSIKLDMEERIPEIYGDTGQIQQVVMNLVINAAEAIDDTNGTIKVALTKAVFEVDQPEADTFGTIIKAGRYACLEVTDTGCGMDEETQKKIFEPFYTTKFTGRGLGMSAIHGIIKSHNGILQLSSTPGRGTTFKTFFPLPDAYDYSETTLTTSASFTKSGTTVLMVEDELALREMGEVLMQSLGFSVLTAQHGLEAIEIYRERGSEINMILLDMIMPVMGGIESYHELRKINLTVPIVICSGYSNEAVRGVIEEDLYAVFVKKPYRPSELRDVMIRMIG